MCLCVCLSLLSSHVVSKNRVQVWSYEWYWSTIKYQLLLSIASHIDEDESIVTNLWSIILIFMWILHHLIVGGCVCLCLSRMQKEGRI